MVSRVAREPAAVIEQFCQANGQILLPIVNLIQNAGQVVETVIYEFERRASRRRAHSGKKPVVIRQHGSQAGRVQLADPVSFLHLKWPTLIV